ncbi:DUF1652 domain-containing protein [Pseudomonas sp. NPDC090202]|uniref:DUF1652 domain-containing protein n=1 Tax=unclassified Pseudomonas TaxID=196821 RepID=UPI0038235097
MLFTPELRRTLECSFLPLACECTPLPDGALMVKVFDRDTGEVAMLLNNVSIAHLNTTRAVAELVAELRYDLRTGGVPFGSPLPHKLAAGQG